MSDEKSKRNAPMPEPHEPTTTTTTPASTPQPATPPIGSGEAAAAPSDVARQPARGPIAHEEALLRVAGLVREFEVGQQKVPVLHGVDLDVAAGELLVIVGRSGSGKSTLLHNMGLLDTPTAGHIYFQGQDLAKLNVEKQSAVRNKHFGFVFQFYHLLPEFTALENVLMPLMIHHGPLQYFRQRRAMSQRARSLLEQLGLGHRLTHRPAQLSGGERQRVAMARALINKPAVVFCDEPTGNLDSKTAEEIHQHLLTLNQGPERQTFVVVTHNYALAQLGTRVLHMQDGHLHQDATDHTAELPDAVV